MLRTRRFKSSLLRSSYRPQALQQWLITTWTGRLCKEAHLVSTWARAWQDIKGALKARAPSRVRVEQSALLTVTASKKITSISLMWEQRSSRSPRFSWARGLSQWGFRKKMELTRKAGNKSRWSVKRCSKTSQRTTVQIARMMSVTVWKILAVTRSQTTSSTCLMISTMELR